MVHLPPATIDQLKNAGRANVQTFYGVTIMVRAAFPPHGPKYIAGAMYGIVPKFNVNVRRALEDSLIHRVWLICSPPNPSERIINGDLIGMSKVIVDHLQITSVEPAVKLSQCLLRLA
ncbi:hypothetical protein SAMN05216525_13216 [Bradyrhizobium sp. Gha]|nr:hypothetical protein SAMN05216525_13216 [Bradyrhizobium sp. Gha]